MGSVYRRNHTDAQGRTRKAAKYTISYRDERGRPRTASGFRDKRASEEKLRKIEERVDRLRAGLPVAQLESERRGWLPTVEAYRAELLRLGRTAQHAATTVQQLTDIGAYVGGGKPAWLFVEDITADGLCAFLAHLSTRQPTMPTDQARKRGWNRKPGRLGPASARTCNAYRDSLAALCSWCVERGWLVANPIDRVAKTSLGRPGDTSKRPRARRALTLAEFQALTTCAKVQPWRRVLYQVAGLSGLRGLELHLLQPCDFTLGVRPRFHLRPEITKGKRLDTVPMLPECAALLGRLADGLSPDARVFPRRPNHHTVERDLERAKVARRDYRGRFANFHSLRYFFCTLVGKELPIQRVRQLMRHQDIRTTCNLYLDLGIEDVADQLAALPELFKEAAAQQAEKEKAALQERAG